MSDPVFKILRCDAEASHMLGFAKKEVRRLVDYAKLDSFKRTWKFGDVTVDAHYFGGVARLALSAEGTERMAVWATVPNPVPFRSTRIAQSGNFTVLDPPVGTIVEYPYGVFASDMELLHEFKYTQYDSPNFYVGGERFMSQNDVNATFAISFRGIWIRDDSWAGGDTVFTYDVKFAGVPPSPEYPYADLQAYAVPTKVEGVPSDCLYPVSGSTTPPWPGSLEYQEIPYTIRFTYFEPSTQSEWESQRQAQQRDVLAPRNAAWRKECSEALLAGFRTGNFDLPYGGVSPAAGELPPTIRNALFGAAPVSKGVVRKYGVREPQIQTSDPVTTERVIPWGEFSVREITYTTTRATTFEVEVAEEGGAPAWRTETITGTCALRLIGSQPDVGPFIMRADVTYTDWYTSDDELRVWFSAGSGLNFNSPTPMDTRWVPQEYRAAGAPVLGGYKHRMWSGAATFLHPSFANYAVLVPDTAFGVSQPVVGEYEWLYTHLYGVDSYWTDGSGQRSGMSLYKNSLVGAVPAPIWSWATAKNNTLRYSKDNEAVSTLDPRKVFALTAFLDGMYIDVVPFESVTDADENLGMNLTTGLPVYDPSAPRATKIVVYGRATYKYDVDRKTFVWVRWAALTEPATIPIVTPTKLGQNNVLLIYGGIKWDDVKEDARAQRKALKDPNDPAYDPLMKAVLDALKQP